MKQTAYSAGVLDKKTSGIKILPVSFLEEAGSPLAGTLTDSTSISGLVGLEQNFFYRIESYNADNGGLHTEIQRYEEGIGEVVKTTVLYGDFNNDGYVDAADYSVWQNYLGSGSSFLNGNGTGEDLVVQADYELWSDNFGNSLSNGDGVDTYWLKREIPFRFFEYPSSVTLPTNNHLYSFSSGHLALSTYVPSEYMELCASPDSVLCTTEAFNPKPIEIEPSSVLGRGTGDLESLNSTKLKAFLSISDPVTDIEANVNDFTLKSSTFQLAATGNGIGTGVFISDSMYLRPRDTQPVLKAQGFLFYNHDTNTFQGFDGTKWRSLKWEDDE